MENFNGFKRYGSLVGVTFVDAEYVPEIKKESESPTDKILKLIFSKDSNGWPSTSVATMLSDKTSDDVRKFIQDNLFSLSPEKFAVSDDKVVSEYRKLDSEFIAMASRNRFESIENYEKRLTDIMSEFEKNETKQKTIAQMRKLFLNENK